MRRWLSLLLLVLLPLQFTWAAAAGYCQHEAGNGVRHFGHHVHQHGAAQLEEGNAKAQSVTKGDTPGDKTPPGKLAADNDCGVCHLGTSNAVGDPSVTVMVAGTDVMHGLARGVFSTRAPDHPDRPNWRIA